MSVSNLVVSQRYAGTGAQTTFAIPFAYLTGTASTVTKVYTVSTLGVKTLKTITTHYTLTGSPPANVEFVTAPAASLKVLIEREVTLTQAADYINTGPFLAETHESVMDRLTFMVQQLDNKLSRAPLKNILDDSLSMEMPIAAADAILVVNDDATAMLWASVADVINLEGSLAVASNLSDLASVATALTNLGISPLSTQTSQALTEGQAAANITGLTLDSTVYSSGVYEFEILRGTGVFSTGRFSLHYRDSAWELVLGEDIYADAASPHGVTFSLSGTGTAQIKVAVASDGEGNGTIKIKAHKFTV